MKATIANSDLIQYRLKVLLLLRANKAKYPKFNEFYELTKNDGSIAITVISLTQIFDAHFYQNLTISTCASCVEEVTIQGEEEAQRVFDELLNEMKVSDTKH